MEKKKQIIAQKAAQLFSRRGFRKVTMEDIARKSGISKKSIYFYFQSKNELVDFSIEETMTKIKRSIDTIENQATNYVDASFRIFCELYSLVFVNNPVVYLSLYKGYPSCYKKFFVFLWDLFKTKTEHFLYEGVKEGLIIREVDPEWFYLQLSNQLFNALHGKSIFCKGLEKNSLAPIIVYDALCPIVTPSGSVILEKLRYGICLGSPLIKYFIMPCRI
jgi:AcrR family transcriptional regulator